MKRLLTAFICLFSSVALADFSGAWKGSGRAQGNDWQSRCDRMGFEVSQQSGRFNILSGFFQCGDNQLRWEPMSARIVGQSLYYGVVKVGTITENAVHIDAVDPTERIRVVVDAAYNGQHLVYREMRWSLTGTRQLVMDGVLKR